MIGVVTASALNVRAMPNQHGRKLGIVNEGTVLSLLGQKLAWYEIQYKNQPAFVSAAFIDVRDQAPNQVGIVDASRLNVRSQPTTSSAVLGLLPRGTTVAILGKEPGWLEIEYADGVGFVAERFVTVFEHSGTMPGTVAASRLNVRSLPSTDGEIIGQLTGNTRITVEADLGEWLQLTFNNSRAYVASAYVKRQPDAEVETDISIAANELTDTPEPATPISQDRTDELAPDYQLPVQGDATERQLASTWNRFGGLLTHLSGNKDIDVACSISVLCVESSGKGFEPANRDRMIIRFENHKFWKYWGRQHPEQFHDHFQYKRGQAWKGHRWRKTEFNDWATFHGNQAAEWEVLDFARSLDEPAALQSISMGAPQIMGFHYKGLGYASPLDMFNDFSSGIGPQIHGLFEFLSDTMLLRLRNRDFEGFAALYNGSGQKEYYGGLLKKYYTLFKRVAH